MTAYPGTIATTTRPSGRAFPTSQPMLRRVAGRIGTAFTALRDAIDGAQLGPVYEQRASGWAGARV